MSEIPHILPEFLEKNKKLARTRQNSSSRQNSRRGGPYTKNDRVGRRNEVFRLHFSFGYSAIQISQMMKVNRHTINDDIKYLYSEMAKDWNRGQVDSWLMKQVYRLEEQRTRLLLKLEKAADDIYLHIEREIKDIDFKIFHMISKASYSRETNINVILKELNEQCKKNLIPASFIRPFDLIKISKKTNDQIRELIKWDLKNNQETWVTNLPDEKTEEENC